MITQITNSTQDNYNQLFAQALVDLRADKDMEPFAFTTPAGENDSYKHQLFNKSSSTSVDPKGDLYQKNGIGQYVNVIFSSIENISEDDIAMNTEVTENDIEKGIDAYSTKYYVRKSDAENPVTMSTLHEYYYYMNKLVDKNIRYARVPLDEPYFNIDANTRKIQIPDHFKKHGVGVQGDIGAETIWFRINRYFDGMDFANEGMEHFIQWEIPNEPETSTDRYGVSSAVDIDYETEIDWLYFGWDLKDVPLTKNQGSVKFSIRFMMKDSNENVIYSFSTQTESIGINQTLHFSPDSTLIVNKEQEPENAIKARLSYVSPVTNGLIQLQAPQFKLPEANCEIDLTQKDTDGTRYAILVAQAYGPQGEALYNWQRTDNSTGKSGDYTNVTPPSRYVAVDANAEYDDTLLYYEKDANGYKLINVREDTWETHKNNIYIDIMNAYQAVPANTDLDNDILYYTLDKSSGVYTVYVRDDNDVYPTGITLYKKVGCQYVKDPGVYKVKARMESTYVRSKVAENSFTWTIPNPVPLNVTNLTTNLSGEEVINQQALQLVWDNTNGCYRIQDGYIAGVNVQPTVSTETKTKTNNNNLGYQSLSYKWTYDGTNISSNTIEYTNQLVTNEDLTFEPKLTLSDDSTKTDAEKKKAIQGVYTLTIQGERNNVSIPEESTPIRQYILTLPPMTPILQYQTTINNTTSNLIDVPAISEITNYRELTDSNEYAAGTKFTITTSYGNDYQLSTVNIAVDGSGTPLSDAEKTKTLQKTTYQWYNINDTVMIQDIQLGTIIDESTPIAGATSEQYTLTTNDARVFCAVTNTYNDYSVTAISTIFKKL